MADAAPSGGGGWTALEIIIVVILGLAIISRFQKTPIVPVTSTSTKKTTTTTTVANPTCGMTISNPRHLEIERGSVLVAGTVSNCKWSTLATSGTLNIQVIDGHGNQVSNNTSVQEMAPGLSDSASFSYSVPLTVIPTTTNGYVLIMATTNTTDENGVVQKPLNMRIPVQFQQ